MQNIMLLAAKVSGTRSYQKVKLYELCIKYICIPLFTENQALIIVPYF